MFAAVMAGLLTLGAAGRPDDAAVVAKLVDALRDPDVEVRQSVGEALAKLPAAAVGPLTAALKDPAPARRAGAAYALGLVGEPAADALAGLLDAVADPDLEVRRQAARAVSRVLQPARRLPPVPVPVAGRGK